MNPASFNQGPYITPTKLNPNLMHMYQFPMLPMNYQMLSMPTVNPFPSIAAQQLTAMQLFYGNLANQQLLFSRNSPNMFSSALQNNSAFSNCYVIDEDPTINFSKQQMNFIDPEYIKLRQNIIGKDFIEKEEYMTYPKIEQKLEEDTEDKSEADYEGKQESFDDDFQEKQEAFDSSSCDKTSVSAFSSGVKTTNLKLQLKEIITFIIEHHGQIRTTDLEKERAKYQNDPVLSRIFNVLYSKYSSTFKTRAEIVKYITRKAFSTIKNNSKNKVDSSSKEAYEVLCKRYFQSSSEEIQSSGVDIEKRERFLQLLFPYQKNSKNKVQDTELITKLMSSKEFYEDYCLYVKNLDSILEADNNRKLPKFINHIISCIKRNQLDNIMKYKRVPWLKSWIENTKALAKELAFSIQWKSQQKPSKIHHKESPSQSQD